MPADALLLGSVLIWSFNFTVTKYAMSHGFEPFAYAGIRYTLAALLFVGLTLARGESVTFRRADWFTLGVVAIGGTVLNQLCFNYGIHLASASTIALVFGLLPVAVGLISRGTGVERPSFQHWVATGVSCTGVALVAAGARGGLSGDLGGILCGVGAVTTFAAFTVAVTPLNRIYSPFRMSALISIGAGIGLSAAGSGQIAGEDWGAIPPLAWGAFAFATVVGFVVTNVLWITAIRRVGGTRASLYVNLQPFLGAVFAVLLLNEHLTRLQVAGGLVIGAGIVLSRQWRAPAALE